MKERIEATRLFSFIRDIPLFEEEDVEIVFFKNMAVVDKLPYFFSSDVVSDKVTLENIVAWSFEQGELLDLPEEMFSVYEEKCKKLEETPIETFEVGVTNVLFAIETSFNSSAKRKKSFFRILSLGEEDEKREISFVAGPIKPRSRLDTVFLQIGEFPQSDKKFDLPVNLELFYQILKYGFYDCANIQILILTDGFILKHKYKTQKFYFHGNVL